MSTEENETEEELEEKFEKKETVNVRVKHEGLQPSDKELKAKYKAEKKKREELELVVEAEALKDFEDEKEQLLQKIPEEKREKMRDYIGEDPDKLESVRANLILSSDEDDDEDDEEYKKPTVGKAMLLEGSREGQSNRRQYSNPVVQMFSDLYRVIRDPKSSEEARKEAESRLDDAFVEISKGLKARPRGSPYMLPTGVVNHCYKCGMVSEVDLAQNPCPYCGYDMRTDKFPKYPYWQPETRDETREG